MKRIISVLFAPFIVVIFFSLGYSRAFAQSPESQVTGSEFGTVQPQGFSDSQFSLLWGAYNNKSDSLLRKFFNNWRLETQIVEEPPLSSPVDNATASLFTFLLKTDFQDSVYPYTYAVIQNQIEVTEPSTVWSSDNGYELANFHPHLGDTGLPILLMLDDRYTRMLGDFFGDWSVNKAQAAQEFFGGYVPFGADVDYYDQQASWSLIRHWYSFEFTSNFQEAFVTDDIPSRTDHYTCVVGPDGNWMKIMDEALLNPTLPPEPPADPGPGPDPLPLPPPDPGPGPIPYPPPHHPHPISPVAPPVIVSPAPSPKPAPTPRPRPIPTPIHPTNPPNPINVGRPRPVAPSPHNPTTPQPPIQPVHLRPTVPPPQPPTDRPRQNPPRVNPPPTPQNPPQVKPPSQPPVERPRATQPSDNKPATTNTSPRSTSPPDKKTSDQTKDRPR